MDNNKINRNITTFLETYPYPAYEFNKIAAGVFAGLVGVSLIGLIIQSILIRFQPIRLNILILLSHLTMFVHLVLRAALSTETNKSKATFTAMTVLLAISLRTIIFANYDFLVRIWNLKKWISRALLIGPALAAIASVILMAPANSLGYNPDTIETSFRLRKASNTIVLGLTIVFYPVWFATKTIQHMNTLAIIFLIISSICCLIVSIFLVVTSIPKYYIRSNEQEFWTYIFQIIPTMVAQFTWTILHPKRTLVKKQQFERGTESVTTIDL
ncbi:unnamed protein product [Rotaria sordida]|uniref:Uncharacterized protein n=1 Tax=Rotaria sordida TaxID=392033 RepID=A0A814GHC9_9BILA|nr:unnamed protein product [Rotaria sordida]CAF1016593.1 unnamed protein product [Rotaria sordida]CAF4004155.1 unnamed protein product [Rotaria sordida]